LLDVCERNGGSGFSKFFLWILITSMIDDAAEVIPALQAMGALPRKIFTSVVPNRGTHFGFSI